MKRALALLPLSIVVACTLTTNLDDFSGGFPAKDGAAPKDVVTTPPKDGSADANIVPTREAGTEAGAPPTCPDKPVALCEEFDADEKKNGWQVTQANGASIAPATVPWGERGLLVSAPQVATGDAPYAYWEKKFDKTVSKASFDIDLEYDQSPTNSGEFHNTFELRLEHGATYNIIYLSVNSSVVGWVVQDFPSHPGDIDYRVVPVSPRQRHHVHFDIEVGGRSQLVVDGVMQSDNPVPAYLLAGQPAMQVGVTVFGVPSTAMTMGFGHLVFTAE